MTKNYYDQYGEVFSINEKHAFYDFQVCYLWTDSVS